VSPPSASGYTEKALVEDPAIALFHDLEWDTINALYETYGPGGTLGRETDHEVVLVSRLRPALAKLNPDLPGDALDQAVEELTRDRSAMSPVRANQQVYDLLKGGIPVTFRREDGTEDTDRVRLIDWRDPSQNDFLLVSQFWMSGDMYKRRADLVGFVNGLPLVLVELKTPQEPVRNAFDDNIRDYKESVPALFWYNGLILLSNGTESRVGSTTAPWEHFGEWKRVADENEPAALSLESVIRGTCDPRRLLDLIENFTVFEELKGTTAKILAKNHQYLGVNRAIDAVRDLRENQGRLGVFWHTQGSGKSLSMLFFAQKILRTVAGNWTFVIVTDREELDEQIYKEFVACGAVTEKRAQAMSGAHLRQLLSEDHRYVFTLIQKFRTEEGQPYPKLTDRSDVIVITDEAHRSQYDTFAMNMRTALPNAAFIGFTGTPLMAGEEKTRGVFGDYVSIYNFQQSIEDRATVPLFRENRIPELQLTNQDLNTEMERLLEDAELDEAQERKLEREFSREYHLIIRDDRLEKVAEDLVRHFVGRGHRGKGMVVCIDKATAVRMYDKVQVHWAKHLATLRAKLATAPLEERPGLADTIQFMETTDMAVVVSQAQNEIADMAQKGLDIRPHRKRMLAEDLDTKFKDPTDPLRLVFVCAMWMTGFDVPSCSTIYLDKPMRNHTLMQTIARANRVFGEKVNGLIVDYVGVFRDLQKALAIYAAPRAGGEAGPIKNKSELVALLQQAVGEALAFLVAQGIDATAIQEARGYDRLRLLADAREALVKNDETKRQYQLSAGKVARIYGAILPDPAATEFTPIATLLWVLVRMIRALTPPADISEVMGEVEALLDRSIAAEGYVIPEDTGPIVDLGQIDFDKLHAAFATARKRTEIQKLRALLQRKLTTLVQLNRSRVDYLERFEKMIAEYNAGSQNIEAFFEQLLKLAQELTEEERRSVTENLTEEELAVFDILTKPDPTLTKAQEADVKKTIRGLLEKLKHEKLVLDWRKRQQARQAVRLCIEEELDKLPEVYSIELYQEKCEATYRHVYDAYYGEGRSLYSSVAA
jgi:type I restriction enzyme R subunit